MEHIDSLQSIRQAAGLVLREVAVEAGVVVSAVAEVERRELRQPLLDGTRTRYLAAIRAAVVRRAELEEARGSEQVLEGLARISRAEAVVASLAAPAEVAR